MVLEQRWEARDRERLAVLQNWERVFTTLESDINTDFGTHGGELRLVREGQQVRAEWRGKEWVGFLSTLEGHLPDKGNPFQTGDGALSDYIQLRPVSQATTTKEERYVGRIEVIFTEQVHPSSSGRTYKLEPDTTEIRLHIRVQSDTMDPQPEWRGEAKGLSCTYRPPRQIPLRTGGGIGGGGGFLSNKKSESHLRIFLDQALPGQDL